MEYTPKFFRALEEMVDKRPHTCKQCGVKDGEHRWNKDHSRQKFPAVVRLCVDDVFGPKNKASNIAMFCTRCRKPDMVWRTPRRIKPGQLPQLY